MSRRYPIQHIMTSGLERFKCKCGRKEFNVTDSYMEPGEPQLGYVEKHFYCDCKESYIWEYGNIRKAKGE